jgi:hypothetical protein
MMAEGAEGQGCQDEQSYRRRPRWCLLRMLELCPLLLLTCSPGDHRRARYDATSSVVLLSLGALGGASAQETGEHHPHPLQNSSFRSSPCPYYCRLLSFHPAVSR